MKNYKLDTSLLPEVWLTWENKSGKIYMNGNTGKRQTNPENWMRTMPRAWNAPDDGKLDCGCGWYTQYLPHIWVKSGSNLIYAYAKYHEDIERLEVAAVKYDTTRGEYAHEWKFAGRRFFIGKDKSCILDDGSKYVNGYKSLYQHHSAYNTRYMLRLLVGLHCNDHFTEEFKKFIGTNSFTIGNGTSIDIKNPWHIGKWYETVQKTRGKGKQQKLTDKLTAIPLRDANEFIHQYPAKPGPYAYTALKDIMYCEKVDDEWCVLRSFKRLDDDSLTEDWRIYINNDGSTRIVSPTPNGWVPSTKPLKRSCNYAYIANKDEAQVICPRIKYILSAANLKEEYEEIDFLVAALRFPEIEQMCKLGWGKTAKSLSRSHTIKADLKDTFGGYYNEKAKNLLQKIGMTKAQLDVYSDLCNKSREGYVHYEWRQALSELRQLFGNDITSLDINSFTKYLKACQQYRQFKNWRGDGYIMDNIGLNLDNVRFFKNLVRLMSKQENIFTVVRDAMSAYQNLPVERRFNVDWYFDNVSDAVRIHDALIELKRLHDEERRAFYNLQEAERRKKEEAKCKKLDEERKVYEYEDEQYIIRLPKDSSEIIAEGSTQHICIGSYTSRHALGDTNLFFLRKKSEPNKPFYAIEMSGSKNIVQIHGFGNKWLGNDPDAIPTVIRWMRKHDIKCSKEILTCKATGYGMSREFVPMPVVD